MPPAVVGLAALVATADCRPVMRTHQRQGGQAVVRSRPVSGLLVSLVLTLLVSGCGGPSPETRARQTRRAELGTSTPIPPQPSPTGIDEERAAILTAEAFLPVAPPPPTVSPILVGTFTPTREVVMTEPELTEAMIETAMAKAEARACTGSDRCYALPSGVESARARCTPKDRCRVGLIVGGGGRESFDVWLEVSTGLVKLIPQSDA